jgi:hypothetical protein
VSEQKRHALGRRRFLAGIGVGAAALPFLPSLVGRAQDAASPKRLVVFHTPNGLPIPGWQPAPGASGFLGRIQESLSSRHGDRLLLLDGINMVSPTVDPAFANNHPELYTHSLTATNMRVDPALSHYQKFFGGGPSVDQKIARWLNDGTTRFESFAFGVDPQGAHSSQSNISYTEEGARIPVVASPTEAFRQLFAGADVGREELQRLLTERSSIIDGVLDAELRQVRARVGVEDHRRIDAHLEGLREMERRLALQAGACAVPDTSAYAGDPAFVRTGKLHMDMLAMSLGCDLVRVANIQWGYGTTNMALPWIDVSWEHHGLSHGRPEGSTTEQRTETAIRIGQWYATMFEHLLDRLEAQPEGSGTLLDHTLVLWTSEHSSVPNSVGGHDYARMPYLLAGNLGGALRMGRRIDFGSRPHNDLFVTLCNLYGLPIDTFGNAAIVTGPLSLG